MNNKLLKATTLALVLVFGSLQGMALASAAVSQPGSFLYPVGMAIGKMGLTTTVAEITEAKPEMEFVQKQAGGGDDCDPIRDRDRDRDGICDGDVCEPIRDRDRDRDGICDGDVCEPAGDQDRDHDGTCDGDVCEPAGDQDRDRDGTCDGDVCEPAGDQDRDGGGGQGGGGH